MNQAHYHLLFNHLPIIIPLVGLLVLISGYLLRSETVKKTGYGVFILSAICTIPAILTGEGAEEIVEQLQVASKQIMHEHEEWGEKLAIANYLLGGLSLLALWASWKQKSFSKIVEFAVLAVALSALFLAKQTGTTGGEIRHTEIRSSNTLLNPQPENTNPENTNPPKDDDD